MLQLFQRTKLWLIIILPIDAKNHDAKITAQQRAAHLMFPGLLNSEKNLKICTACMAYRKKDKCILSEDDAHIVGKITKPGTKKSKELSSFLAEKANRSGKKIVQR